MAQCRLLCLPVQEQWCYPAPSHIENNRRLLCKSPCIYILCAKQEQCKIYLTTNLWWLCTWMSLVPCRRQSSWWSPPECEEEASNAAWGTVLQRWLPLLPAGPSPDVAPPPLLLGQTDQGAWTGVLITGFWKHFCLFRNLFSVSFQCVQKKCWWLAKKFYNKV